MGQAWFLVLPTCKLISAHRNPELGAAVPHSQARNSVHRLSNMPWAWGDGVCGRAGGAVTAATRDETRGSAKTWCCPSQRPKKKLPDDLSLGTSTQTTLTSHFTCREVFGGWKKKEEVCTVKSCSRA